MWKLRRVARGNEIYIGMVYFVEGEAKLARKTPISWYKDSNTLDIQQQLKDAFILPIIDEGSLTEEVF